MFIGFVGMSHLSLTYLIATAQKNYNVIAYDNNKNKISNLINYNEYFNEKTLLNSLKKNKKKIFFTNNKKYLKKCKLIFISPDILTDRKNRSNYDVIKKYIKSLDKFISPKIPFIIQSQVYPGFCEKYLNGKRQKYYQVETLIFGKALQRALYPEQIIIGSDYKKIKNKIYKNYISKFNTNVRVIPIKDAELTKIAINLFLATSLTTTNLLARYSEAVNIDYNNIVPTLKFDKRIGKYSYTNPGLGISGGNIERDVVNFSKLLNEKKINNKFFKEIINFSSERKKWVIKILNSIISKKNLKNISIFGISYKKDNSSIKNSASIVLIKDLLKIKKIKLNIYDDIVDNYKNLKIHKEHTNLIRNSDVIIIMRDFKKKNFIENFDLKKISKKKYIIDPFGILNHKIEVLKSKGIKFNYYKLGR